MHSKHAVTSKKHTGHLVLHKNHSKHAVQSRHHAAGTARPFQSLGTALEELLDIPAAEATFLVTPPVDMRETDKTIEVTMEMPGVDKKDINLDLTEDSLAIYCESRGGKNEKGRGGYQYNEESYGRFYRAFTLPAAIKISDSKAVYKNGTLRITLQKQHTDRTRHLTVE
ncbi:MAG TPA: Hsp20/alpha crystallin family protein [Elusimicrobiales bacterium]|nr:Hsp20/alpha crystallin family protein [Elusimicrobiales bacterium]